VTTFYEAGRADANLMLEASNEPVSKAMAEEKASSGLARLGSGCRVSQMRSGFGALPLGTQPVQLTKDPPPRSLF
jgi:hypothetical protein